MKKIVSLIAILLLTVNLLAGTAYADSTVYSEGPFYYIVADESITITGYFGRDSVVTVPSSIAGVPVNAIAPGAFEGTSAETIYLPDTIMAVGEGGAGGATVVFPDTGDGSAAPAQDMPTINKDKDTNPATMDRANESAPVIVSGNQDAEITVDDDEETVPIDTAIKEGAGRVIATPELAATETPQPEPSDALDTAGEEAQQPSQNSNSALWLIPLVIVLAAVIVFFALRSKKKA